MTVKLIYCVTCRIFFLLEAVFYKLTIMIIMIIFFFNEVFFIVALLFNIHFSKSYSFAI